MAKHQSMINCQSIGIDVSKNELAITGRDGNEYLYRAIPNKRHSITHWLKSLKGYQGIIVVESTAWYHFLVSLLCSEHGLDIRVINPLMSSKHAKSGIRKVKSDPADSKNLADMGVTENDLPGPSKITLNRLKHRRMLGLVQGLDKQIQSMRRRTNDLDECLDVIGATRLDVSKQLDEVLSQLKKSKRDLEKELEVLSSIIADEEQIETQAVFASLPGMTPLSSTLSVVLDLDVKSIKSWIGYVGIDISVRQSGTWRGRSRLTKRGNAYLRKRMFQAAWGACLTNPAVRRYYDHLKLQGRCHTEAVLTIARKLLRVSYTLIKSGGEYDATKAFAF